MTRRFTRAGPLVAALALAGAGCTDLDSYSTNEGEAYCGAITLGGGFREGLSPRVQMRLSLDAAELDGPGSPGTLWTYEAAFGDEPERRLIDDAELRRLPAMENDPLSRLEFGQGRLENKVFAVSPSDPEAEAMLAIVSLRSDGAVEVRLLRPGREGGPSEQPEGRRPIFGIFSLTKQVGTCGF